jgi:predicted MFS family arabinose efflux permease
MVFQVSQGSFIALDVVRECSWALLSMCLTLFMAEFAGPIGVAQVSGRYYTLNNIGSLIAPVIALQVAVIFGNDRVPLILVSIIMLIALFYFKDYRVVAADKNAKIATADKTVKKIFGNFREFAKNKSLVNAFITNYGYYAIYSIRSLYVPISVVEAGFTKDILGFILMIGTLPFVLLASPISKFAKKHGCKWILSIGFIAFAICAMMATFSGGLFLLGLFVLWQIPNAMLEPVKELPFYSNATKSQQSKFVGIFKTSSYLAKVITPLIGAFAIWLTGYTASVWLVAAAFAIIAAKFSNQESKKGL